ncbi:MAG: energy-coupling factor transporter transmembrane component T [Candidatus Micrarchaeota archaeon]
MPRETLVHSVDARVKILWLFSLILSMFSSRSIETALLGLTVTFVSCALSSLPMHSIFPKPRFLLFVLAIPLVIGTVFVSPMFGLINALILFSALSISLLFVLTTTQKDIVSALNYFLVPVSTAFSLSMSLYFLPVFERKFNRVRVAQASRAHSGKNPLPIVVPFMHSVMRKAKNLSLSMDARAFDPERIQLGRTFKMKPMDWLALFALLAFVLVRLGLFGIL